MDKYKKLENEIEDLRDDLIKVIYMQRATMAWLTTVHLPAGPHPNAQLIKEIKELLGDGGDLIRKLEGQSKHSTHPLIKKLGLRPSQTRGR